MDNKKNYTWTRLHFFQFEEDNPKEHNLGEITSSIERFGFIELPVINLTTGKLVVGHGRILALMSMYSQGKPMPKFLKLEEDTSEWLIPTINVEFDTDSEAKAYLIASNQLVIDGSWDEVALLDLLHEVNRVTDNLLGTGFDLEDMRQLTEFQDSTNIFDDDFGKQVYYVKIEAESKDEADYIKLKLQEQGFICQVKSITK